jgi:hypothetical protein
MHKISARICEFCGKPSNLTRSKDKGGAFGGGDTF